MARQREFQFSERRFKDLLLYVSKRLADDQTFGETKLNKILFFADFEAFRRLGTPITGAEYQKNHFGPTARLYPVMRDELLSRDQLTVERRMVADHVQDVPAPKNIEPNMTQFSVEEIAIVDAVIEEMRQYTNREVSDLSHERSAGWRVCEMFETIPYSSALINPEPLDELALAGLASMPIEN